MTDRLQTHLVLPIWRALVRVTRPEVRIVTGGIAFYALFAVFPLIYLTLTLLTIVLPREVAASLAQPISDFFSEGMQPLSGSDVAAIRELTPTGLTFRAIGAIALVLFTATSGAKALITGIGMIAGTGKQRRFARYQGASLVLTAALILGVWLLGAVQLAMTAISQPEYGAAASFARNAARFADTLWISKGVASFVFFYLILSLCLRGHGLRMRAIIAGAGAAAIGWLAVTLLFQIYLDVSALSTLFGAVASVILGFVWLSASVTSLLIGAALAVEWSNAWSPAPDAEA